MPNKPAVDKDEHLFRGVSKELRLRIIEELIMHWSMTIEEYLDQVRPLSVYARFGMGLRLFERYVRMRGLEDDVIWEFLEYMWQFPLVEDKYQWEAKRGDLVDFGLGDEIPEELEEELATLGINEDYFGLWVSAVVELAWNNLLKGPEEGESLEHLELLVRLAENSGLGVPQIGAYHKHLYVNENGWGGVVTQDMLEAWQVASCDVEVKGSGSVEVLEQAADFC